MTNSVTYTSARGTVVTLDLVGFRVEVSLDGDKKAGTSKMVETVEGLHLEFGFFTGPGGSGKHIDAKAPIPAEHVDQVKALFAAADAVLAAPAAPPTKSEILSDRLHREMYSRNGKLYG